MLAVIGFKVQDTRSYSENDYNFLFLMASRLSKAEIAANAQHEPHYPWSLIGFTTPYYLQSIELTGTTLEGSAGGIGGMIPVSNNPSSYFLNSSRVKWLNLFFPSLKV